MNKLVLLSLMLSAAFAATVKSASGGELYSETLHYEDSGGSDCDPQYNGNISYMAQRIAHGNRDFVQNRDVAYYYDQQNRLTKTDDLSQDYFDDIFEYDAQGRIVAQRRAYRTDSAQGGEYAYYDSTNRLKSVAEGMGGTGDGRDMSAGDNFVYDHDGNLVEDKSKQMVITYDWRGMPVEFRRFSCRSEGYATVCDSTKLIMAYDGPGRRISKTRMKKTAPDSDWYIDFVTHYTDIGTEIRVGGGNDNGTKIVVPMPQGMGRYRIEQAEYPAEGIPFFEWYLKNHLGSTMMVYRTTGTTAGPPELLFAYDYRSYGEQIDLTVSTDKVTENFTGKELDDETDLGYWGARYLDLMLGGWISVDPMRQFASPYLYAGNRYNPVNIIDPDGNADLRLAIYYNATNDNGENAYYEDGEIDAMAEEFQKELSTQIDPEKDQIHVKAFKEGDWEGIRDFLNEGDVRAIMTHGGKGANYITDVPNTKGETQGNHRIKYSLLQKILKKTFIGACWAKGNINSKKMPNLIKPKQNGSIDVLQATTKYLLENSDTNKDAQKK